jgi:hypothetical protein
MADPSTPAATERESAARLATALYSLRRAYHARVRALLRPLDPPGHGPRTLEWTRQQIAHRIVGERLAADAHAHDALVMQIVDLGLLPAEALHVSLFDTGLAGEHARSVAPAQGGTR